MSRHLMAKFRQAAGAWPKVEWRHGWVLPSRAAEIEHFNTAHDDDIDPADYSTGIVHHGEQRYAIEVSPSVDGDIWSWSIHKQVGPDANNPDHWKHMGGIPNGCFCGWGDNKFPNKLDDRFFGMEHPDDDDEDHENKYPSGRPNAMFAGEEAFLNEVVNQQQHGLGNIDYDQIAREHGPGTKKHHFDEDYGDIFGDGS